MGLFFLLLYLFLLVQQLLRIVRICLFIGFPGEQCSFQCHQNNAQVHENGIVFNVHQVHFQFIIRQGVIQSGDLCIPGESCLHLQPELKFRHGFFIFFCQFWALRSGSHHGHIATENVDELGQLVQTAFPQDASHLGDAAVVFLCQLRSGLFRIHHHAPEFIDVKFLSVIGQTLLLEQHRSAVIQLDGDGGCQHHRRQDHQKDNGKNQVEDTLAQLLLKCQPVVPAEQQRRVEQPDLLCAS